MIRFEYFEWIEAYWKGSLSQTEKVAFEWAMADAPELAYEFEMYCLEWDAMELLIERDLRQQMAIWQLQAAPKRTYFELPVIREQGYKLPSEVPCDFKMPLYGHLN